MLTLSFTVQCDVFGRGGKRLTVYGRYLDSVGAPKALFMDGGPAKSCDIQDSSHMICQFPNFTSAGKKTVIFLMDAIDQNQTTGFVRVLPNPVFDNFTDVKQASSELVLSVRCHTYHISVLILV